MVEHQWIIGCAHVQGHRLDGAIKIEVPVPVGFVFREQLAVFSKSHELGDETCTCVQRLAIEEAEHSFQ